MKATMKAQTAITVVMVSGGYPESYKKGFEITGLDSVTESTVFHAGTKPDSGRVLTDGGRVLAVTSLADGIQPALDKSYRSIGGIKFDGAYFRRDIGQDLQKL
jgi:phosphoribosylamine--glycine ligase